MFQKQFYQHIQSYNYLVQELLLELQWSSLLQQKFNIEHKSEYVIIYHVQYMNIFDFWCGRETSIYLGSMRKILSRKRQPDGLCISAIHHHHTLRHEYSHIRCHLNMHILQPEALYIFQCYCLGNIFSQDKYSYLK